MNIAPNSDSPEFAKLPRENSNFLAYHRFHTPNATLPEVLFLGGFKSDMTGTKATFLDAVCQERKQTYTRFDYFGHGSSSGRFEQGTIGLWLADALAMIDQVTEGPLVLVGSSMGAWIMTLAALARPDRVKALIGIAAAPDFTEELIWAMCTENQRKSFISQGVLHAPSQYEGREFPITLQLVEEARTHLVLSSPLPINCPVHLIHGEADLDVPWTLARRLARQLTSPEVTLTLIKGGDHRLNTPLALGRVASVLDELSQQK